MAQQKREGGIGGYKHGGQHPSLADLPPYTQTTATSLSDAFDVS